eukprot:SAG11_NODE_905_length_6605_cov_4.060406_1_plen_1994_part_10
MEDFIGIILVAILWAVLAGVAQCVSTRNTWSELCCCAWVGVLLACIMSPSSRAIGEPPVASCSSKTPCANETHDAVLSLNETTGLQLCSSPEVVSVWIFGAVLSGVITICLDNVLSSTRWLKLRSTRSGQGELVGCCGFVRHLKCDSIILWNVIWIVLIGVALIVKLSVLPMLPVLGALALSLLTGCISIINGHGRKDAVGQNLIVCCVVWVTACFAACWLIVATGCDHIEGLSFAVCISVLVGSAQHAIGLLDMWKVQRTKKALSQPSAETTPLRNALLTNDVDAQSAHAIDCATVFSMLEEIRTLSHYTVRVILRLTPASKVDVDSTRWRQQPRSDPRTNACVWAWLSARAVIDAARSGMALSFGSVGVVHRAVCQVHRATSDFVRPETRKTLVEAMAILFHATRCLPIPAREKLDASLSAWKALCEGGAAPSEQEVTLPVLRLLLDEPSVSEKDPTEVMTKALTEANVPAAVSMWNDALLAGRTSAGGLQEGVEHLDLKDWRRWIAMWAGSPDLPHDKTLEKVLDVYPNLAEDLARQIMPPASLSDFADMLPSPTEGGSISIRSRAQEWFDSADTPEFDSLLEHWGHDTDEYAACLCSQKLFVYLSRDAERPGDEPETKPEPKPAPGPPTQPEPGLDPVGCSAVRMTRLCGKYTLPFIIVMLYTYRAGRCFWYIGRLEDMANSATTFLPVPGRYDFDDPLQNIIVPIVYGVMHANLVTFGLLPLTMCRTTIRILSASPALDRWLHLDRLGVWHRALGYMLAAGLLLGATLWWIALSSSCLRDGTSCEAFFPDEASGSYFNIYQNAEAVLFLRELVSVAMLVIVLTSSLVFDINVGQLFSGRLCALLRCRKKQEGCRSQATGTCGRYELFYYTHSVMAAAVVVLAFSSRFEVFFPTLPAYIWYACDLLWTIAFDTYKCDLTDAVLFNEPKSVKLRLQPQQARRAGGCLCLPTCRNRCCGGPFEYKAGQTIMVKVRDISPFEWHPFSIASAPGDGDFELLIQVHREGSWTHALYQTVDAGTSVEAALQDVVICGPFGSSFEHFSDVKNVMVISGGSGLGSSLSVLRQACALATTSTDHSLSRLHFVWSARHASHLLWCWSDLKQTLIELEGVGASSTGQFQHLGRWLTISIHVTEASASEARSNYQKVQLMELSQTGNAVGKWLAQQMKPRRPDWAFALRQVYMDTDGSSVHVFCCAGEAVARGVHAAADEFNRLMPACSVSVSGDYFSEGRAGPVEPIESLRQASHQVQASVLVHEVQAIAQRAQTHSEPWKKVVNAAQQTLESINRQDLSSTKKTSLRSHMREVIDVLHVIDVLDLGQDNLLFEDLERQRLFILAILAKDNRSAAKEISLQTMRPARAKQPSIQESPPTGPLNDTGRAKTLHFLPTDLHRQSYSPSDCCDLEPVRAVLGTGSFGTVYRMLRSDGQPDVKPELDPESEPESEGDEYFDAVEDEELHQGDVVAVKVSKEGIKELKKMEEEAKKAHQLTQYIGDHVVPTLSYFTTSVGRSAQLCMVMAVMELGTLYDYIEQFDPKGPYVDGAVVRWIALRLAQGVLAMHSGWKEADGETRCVEHGDIKSDNIFVDADFNIRYGDFGQAYKHGKNTLQSGSKSGHEHYTPPVPEDPKFSDTRKSHDMWALGCVLGELVLKNIVTGLGKESPKESEFRRSKYVQCVRKRDPEIGAIVDGLLKWHNHERMKAEQMRDEIMSLVESEEICREKQVECRLSMPMATGRSDEVAHELRTHHTAQLREREFASREHSWPKFCIEPEPEEPAIQEELPAKEQEEEEDQEQEEHEEEACNKIVDCCKYWTRHVKYGKIWLLIAAVTLLITAATLLTIAILMIELGNSAYSCEADWSSEGCASFHVSGTSGSHSDGVYSRTEHVCNGMPVYQRADGRTLFQPHGSSRWMIGSEARASGPESCQSNGYEITMQGADCASSPAGAGCVGQWEHSSCADGEDWCPNPSIVVRTEGACDELPCTSQSVACYSSNADDT